MVGERGAVVEGVVVAGDVDDDFGVEIACAVGEQRFESVGVLLSDGRVCVRGIPSRSGTHHPSRQEADQQRSQYRREPHCEGDHAVTRPDERCGSPFDRALAVVVGVDSPASANPNRPPAGQDALRWSRKRRSASWVG